MATNFSKQVSLTDKQGNSHDIVIRTLHNEVDYSSFLELEKVIWGQDFSECLPPSMVMVNTKVGGLSAAAFGGDGKILALIFGLTGPQDGIVKHWSHLMGVHPDYRDLGLGKQMKLFQRDYLLSIGVGEVQWTFDPLESKNAHLNMNHLGGLPILYELNVYGEGTGLHAGIGTDRFTLSWRINEERVEHILAAPLQTLPEVFAEAPTVNTRDGDILDGDYPLPDAPLIRIEIPRNIQAVKQTPGMGRRWRLCTRRAFTHYMGAGYQVVRFYVCNESRRGFYVLLAPGEEHP